MKILLPCRLVVLAISLPLASFADLNNQSAILFNGYTVSLDTGTVGTSGGDLIWNGTSLAPQGNAGIYAVPLNNITVSSSIYWSQLTQGNLMSFTYSKSPLTGASIASLSVLAVHTNGGNYAKLFIIES